MASQSNSEFRNITNRFSILETLKHDGHGYAYLNILVTIGGQKCLIMGKDRKYDYLIQFGESHGLGFQTLAKNFTYRASQQSLDCIATREELEYRIRSEGFLVEQKKGNFGNEYDAFINMGDEEFPLEKVQLCFIRMKHPIWSRTHEQRKFSSLHAVPLSSLRHAKCNKWGTCYATDTDGERVRIHERVIPILERALYSVPTWL